MDTRATRVDSERGASLVEFAILAPLLLLLIFGIAEFARGMHEFNVVRNSAREGARFATTFQNTAAGVPAFADCAGIDAAARSLATSAEPANVLIEYFAPGVDPETGTPKADCDSATPPPFPVEQPPYPPSGPDPSSLIINSGDLIVVTSERQFDAVVPLLEAFLDGVDLQSTQERTIFYSEVVNG